MPRGCCVPGCDVVKSTKHYFPIYEEEIYNIWIERVAHPNFVNLSELQIRRAYQVCDEHFIKECKLPGSKRLKNYSIPSVNVPGFHGEATMENSFFYPSYLKHPEVQEVPNLENIHLEHCYSLEVNVEDPIPSTSGHIPVSMEICEEGAATCETSRKRLHSPVLSGGKRRKEHMLLQMHVRTAAELTPKAKFLYRTATTLKKKKAAVEKKCLTFKQRLFAAEKVNDSESFTKWVDSVNAPTYNFILSQLRNQKKKPKARRFSLDDKILALSLYKQSGRGYRLLSKIFSLPSRSTILTVLKKMPLRTGINRKIFQNMKKNVKKLKPLDRNCVIMFDEMAVSQQLGYRSAKDEIEGFEDLGNGQRKPKFAKYALVFMVRGLFRKFKQPVAYVFSENSTKRHHLANLISEMITEVRGCGLQVVATVSDQGTNNCGAINLLRAKTDDLYKRKGEENKGLGYEINGQEVIHIFDVPHLVSLVYDNDV